MVEAFESGVPGPPDFCFMGDDYSYRFEPAAKQRFLDLLGERFNSGVRYRGRALKWDAVIEQKTVELGRYLVGRISRLDFSKPPLVCAESTTMGFGDVYSVSHSRRLGSLESGEVLCIT